MIIIKDMVKLNSIKKIIKNYVEKIQDYPCNYICDVNLPNDNSKENITNVLFTTVPSLLVGKRSYKNWMEFSRKNANWSFLYFDDERINRYLEEKWQGTKILEIYNNSKIGQMKSDIFRYCFLFDNGGVYLDFTKKLRVPIDYIFKESAKTVLSFESVAKNEIIHKNYFGNYPVVQCFMIMPKKSIILKLLIQQIEDNYSKIKNIVFKNPKQAVLEYTGPIAFSNAIYQNLDRLDTNEITILGFDFINSIEFEYPGSDFFRNKLGTYANMEEKVICE